MLQDGDWKVTEQQLHRHTIYEGDHQSDLEKPVAFS